MSETITLRIASVEEALKEPDGYEVTHTFLGWSLAHLGGHCSTLISTHDAIRVIGAQVKDRLEFLKSKDNE